MTTPIVPIVSQDLLYITNMNIAVASNTTLSITAGQCRDSTNLIDINVGNFLGQGNPAQTANSTTTLNAAVNGLNGLDTGSLANSTRYYVYAIGDNTNFNPSGYILSTNATTPLLPFGYSSYRKIGFAKTDGSAHFRIFYITGNGNRRLYTYDEVQTIKTTGGSTSYAALDISAFIASGSQEVVIQFSFDPNTAANSFNFRPTGSSSVSNTGCSNPTTTPMLGTIPALTNAAGSIDWKTQEASDALILWIYSFVVYL